MNVLITGSSGFIGRAFMRHLLPRGKYWEPPFRENRVIGIDIRPQVPGVASGYLWDARDFFRSQRTEANTHYDLVIHCAATVGGRATIDGDPMAVATNLALDSDMFHWAMRTRPGRVVYFSSSAAYPVGLQAPGLRVQLAERHVDLGAGLGSRPDQTYGWTKLTGEMMAEHVNGAGIPVHVFRPFSGYGSDQCVDYPFGAFIDRAMHHEDPFEVWGDGTQVRDWIHVDDIVGAVFAAIEQDVRSPVNLCTGIPTSFADLAQMVTSAAGYQPRIAYRPDKPTGVSYRVGDPTLMRTFYEPTVTLEQGIKRALAERTAEVGTR